MSVKCDSGDWAEVSAITTGKSIKWVVLDKGLKLYDPAKLKDPKVALVTGVPGTYRLMALAILADEASEPAYCLVTIGGLPPPIDTMVQDLKDAYALETATDKAATLEKLTSLYKKSDIATSSPTIKTWAALISTMKAAAVATGCSGKLLGVQKVIAAANNLPTKDGPLDDDAKKAVAAKFARVADALSKVTP